ncbi:hypothetical protein PTSG_04209 [Salpingoeca rosetta]|uniref:Pseudouridine synthase RsuA/RluA-like domain-containing protein n=1 Tax=Salpingoeca rosetta (strain ATCC 50818 / BSB-021) TaxID=946362 RepID=F2U6W9_SALR5|nr:uncharacterized protein PTSG_04209 [Salpingoeca rosetta]EGD83601.1 hypothetical protein PTSG_04209 [Salpingoeca rosetta]|eukprot:XP_004995105.1 hypothetical protein PTSG_04209 [Salpingoeca rosetta]
MGDRQLRQLARRLWRAVLFEDRHVLCINKWPQLVVQGGTNEPSIARALPYLAQELPPKGSSGRKLVGPNHDFAPSIVHRLDKDTTGVTVIAKHAGAARILNNLFAEHQVDKRYLAMTLGAPYPEKGRLDFPIGTNKDTGATACITPTMSADERSALTNVVDAATNYRVIDNIDHHIALVDLKPHTGRKHQLRVHCAQALHCPIVGDNKYGPGVTPWLSLAMRTPSKTKRKELWSPPLFLHAARITIPRYADHFAEIDDNSKTLKPRLDVSCPLPPWFDEVAQRLKLRLPRSTT